MYCLFVCTHVCTSLIIVNTYSMYLHICMYMDCNLYVCVCVYTLSVYMYVCRFICVHICIYVCVVLCVWLVCVDSLFLGCCVLCAGTLRVCFVCVLCLCLLCVFVWSLCVLCVWFALCGLWVVCLCAV